MDHGAVRGPGRDDRDQAARLRHRPGDPDSPRQRVLDRVAGDRPDRAAKLLGRARDQHAAGTPLQHRRDDPRDLLRGLAVRQDGLGRTLAQLAMQVGPGEAEVAERQSRECLECRLGLDLATADRLE